MLADFLLRARALLRRDVVETEIADELRFHLDHQVSAYLAQGMDRSTAERRARLELGGLDQTREEYRDALGTRMLDDFLRDVRYSARRIGASPSLSALAVLSLAVGLGGAIALFGMVNALLLRPLPVRSPETLAILSSGSGPGSDQWTSGVWDEINRRAAQFDGAFAWAFAPLNISPPQLAEPARGLFASGGFLTTLGVHMSAGRPFIAADDAAGGGIDGAVAVVSAGFAERRFTGAAAAIGSFLTVNGKSVRIIGVTDGGFFGVDVGRTFDVMLPLALEPSLRERGSALNAASTRWLHVMLRRRPSQSLEEATARLGTMQPEIRDAAMPTDLPELREGFLREPLTLVSGERGVSVLRERYRAPLLAMMALVAGVLVIACANVGSLLLARTLSRHRELSLRLALGATRTILVRQLLIEGGLLSALGMVIGVFVANWLGRALVATVPPMFGAPISLDTTIDFNTLQFGVILLVGSAALTGVLPALRTARSVPIEALRDHTTQQEGGRKGRRLSRLFVVGQAAVCLTLLIAAGLFIQTFRQLTRVRLGFDTAQVVLVDVRPSPGMARGRGNRVPELLVAARSIPGVEAAAASVLPPIDGNFSVQVVIGGGGAGSSTRGDVPINFVSAGWFDTYGIPIIEGRDVSNGDTASSEGVVVVNRIFARRFFGALSPIGRYITVAVGPGGSVSLGARRIVAVVGDAVARSIREPLEPVMYLPAGQWPTSVVPLPSLSYLAVRRDPGAPTRTIASVVAALRGLDPEVRLSIHELRDDVAVSFAQERLTALVSGWFGALAMLLAALGIGGVTAHWVEQQRVEIAIRMALGSSRSRIIGSVIGRMTALVAAGVTIGAGFSLLLSRFVARLLFGLSATDGSIYAAAIALLAIVGLVAALLPLWLATSKNPSAVLQAN